MSEFSRDPFNNIIQAGMKDEIQFCFDNKRYRAMVILCYSAIDSLAFLAMPENQTEVTRKDFIAWADRYFRIEAPHAPTGDELYGARCAMLHSYGIDSRGSRAGTLRVIGFMNDPRRKVIYRPEVSKQLVMVSLMWFKSAVIQGISKCMIELQANPEKYPKTDERLKMMMSIIPYSDDPNKEQ